MLLLTDGIIYIPEKAFPGIGIFHIIQRAGFSGNVIVADHIR